MNPTQGCSPRTKMGGRKKRPLPEAGDAKPAKKAKVAPAAPAPEPPRGYVLTFGQGDTGQLGLGHEPNKMEKAKPGVVDIPDTVQVCAGGMHTVCVTRKGEVYTFGCNDEGALGRKTEEDEDEQKAAEDEEDEDRDPELEKCAVPGRVEFPDGHQVVMVSAGDSHTAAVTKLGKLFFWGTFRDSRGAMEPKEAIKTAPTLLDVPHRIVKVASGGQHVVALTSEGKILTFGNAEHGELGRIQERDAARGGRKGLDYILKPRLLPFPRRALRFSDVWCGDCFSFAKEEQSGAIWGWGLNNYFQLGLSDPVARFRPERIPSFADKDWTSISGGQHHTLALASDGVMYSLGCKEYGRLGLGEEGLEEKAAPTPIASPPIQCVSAGSATSYAVTTSGEVLTWGMGTSSMLMVKDDEDDLFVPTVQTGRCLEDRRVDQVSAGGQHVVLLASSST